VEARIPQIGGGRRSAARIQPRTPGSPPDRKLERGGGGSGRSHLPGLGLEVPRCRKANREKKRGAKGGRVLS